MVSERPVQADAGKARRIRTGFHRDSNLGIAGRSGRDQLGGIVPIAGGPDGKNVGADLGQIEDAHGHNVYVSPGQSVTRGNPHDKAGLQDILYGLPHRNFGHLLPGAKSGHSEYRTELEAGTFSDDLFDLDWLITIFCLLGRRCHLARSEPGRIAFRGQGRLAPRSAGDPTAAD